jgi:hypothetical protein
MPYLHGQSNCVEYNCHEYGVFKAGRGHEPPDLVLKLILGYVLLDGPCLERELDTLALILVQVAVLELLLALVLKCDNHKTDEDVDHEEGDHDNVGDEEDGDGAAIVVNGAIVLLGRVNRFVEHSRRKKKWIDFWIIPNKFDGKKKV